jgi:LysM repeat protein
MRKFTILLTGMLLAGFLFLAAPIARADGPAYHVVAPGETLWSISVRYGVTLDALVRANGLVSSNWIYAGQLLVIPRNVRGNQYHTVRLGETVWSISNEHGVSAWALVQQNRIVSNLIYVGQTLVIPPAPGFPGKIYTVQPGDWFYAIARRFGVSVDALQAANPNLDPRTLYPGMVLNLPETATGNVATATPRPNSSATPPAGPNITSTPRPTSTPIDGFGYGVQLNWTNQDNDQEMAWIAGMGFGWAKIQIRWCDLEQSPGAVDYVQIDRIVNAAAAKGIHLMFSIVCAPNWSRGDGGQGGSGPPDDLQKAADFSSQLAARYCGRTLGAVEVWNEQNLLSEWHGKALSAATYMDMLRRSYTGIKARCPSIQVLSGGPTPTGITNSTAIDDVSYLRQMYASGLKQYSDAVGAHPSGFCNSPSAAEGTSNPCGGQFNNHRSFFFKRTLEAYRAVMQENGDSGKRIRVTEFGWGVDPSPKPGYEYTKFLTEDLQSAWEVEAFQSMKTSGYVDVAFLWNLDFTDMTSETGAFHILNRRAYTSLAGMVK